MAAKAVLPLLLWPRLPCPQPGLPLRGRGQLGGPKAGTQHRTPHKGQWPIFWLPFCLARVFLGLSPGYMLAGLLDPVKAYLCPESRVLSLFFFFFLVGSGMCRLMVWSSDGSCPEKDTHKFFAYNFRRFPSDAYVWAPWAFGSQVTSGWLEI